MREYAYVVNVDAVVVRDDEYLLVERAASEDHAAGLLGFPGGKLEEPPAGEDAVAATAAREVREEVGVEVGSVDYLYSSTFEADTGDQCLNVLTYCEHAGGEVRVREPDEVAAVHWLTYDDLRERDDVPTFTEQYAELAEERRTSE